MCKRPTCLLVLALACSLPIGCGDAASSGSAYDQALQKVGAAGRGFAPATQGSESAPVAAYRQDALTDAAGALDQVIASDSSPHKVGAYRLRAEVDASAARYAALQAATAYARLAPEAVQKSSYALAAQRAAARAGTTGVDQGPLLDSLRQTIQQQQQRLASLREERQQLRAELQTLEGQRETIRERRDAAAAEVARLRNQAFVARGEEQFRLQDDAATAERQGTLAATEMARKQLDIDMIESRLSVVDSQIELAERVAANLQQRLEQTQSRQAEVQQTAADAQRTREEELARLTDAFEQIWNQFGQQVDAPLNDASVKTAAAVQHLKQAGSVPGANAQTVQFDLLSAQMTRVEILVEHLQTLASFQQVLELVAQAAGDQSPVFRERISRLQQTRGQLAQLAAEAIAEGRDAAQRAMSGPGLELAQQRAQRLEAYSQQVQQLQG